MDDTVHFQKIHKNIRFVDVGEISKIPDVRNFGKVTTSLLLIYRLGSQSFPLAGKIEKRRRRRF
jgi:hypothetical protein